MLMKLLRDVEKSSPLTQVTSKQITPNVIFLGKNYPRLMWLRVSCLEILKIMQGRRMPSGRCPSPFPSSFSPGGYEKAMAIRCC